jgi:hypothetical protein
VSQSATSPASEFTARRGPTSEPVSGSPNTRWANRPAERMMVSPITSTVTVAPDTMSTSGADSPRAAACSGLKPISPAI